MRSTPSGRLASSFFRAFLCFAFGLSVAACGGGGGGGGVTPQTASFPGLVSPQSTATTTSTTSISTSGTIVGLITGGFVLDTGYPHGKIDVYVTSTTTISGPTPYVNEQVSVTGTGSWSTSITATSVSQGLTTTSTVATPTPSPIPIPTGVISTQGKIAGLRTGGFTLDQGYPYGKIPVYTTSTTAYFGGAVVTGQWAQVTGVGSVHTGISSATVVSITATQPSNITETGTIVGGTTYGFTLNVSTTYPSVPIVVTTATVIGGGVLMPGAIAQVYGPGTLGTSITPSQIVVTDPTPQPVGTPTPTPGPIAQKHMLTADYLGGYYGTTSISWSTAAQYLTWASTNAANANAISSTGMKTMLYTDPNRVQSNDPMYTTNETTFAHDCSGNRITDTFGTTTQYVMDVTSSSLWTLYHNTLVNQIGTAHFDAIFEDDAGPLSGYTGFSALPCNYTDSAWLTGGKSLNDAATSPVIFNGESGLQGHSVSLSLGLLSDSNTLGGNYEHCYTDDTNPAENGWLWQAVENSELQTIAQSKLFECQERNSSTASTAQAARIYGLASFMLTYNPSTSVLWEMFATPSGFHVEPESQLVALNPVVAQPSSITGLQTASGVYGREYQDCYIAGNFVGPCAMEVNSDPTLTMTNPYPQYTHTLVLSGGGIVDGGTIATNGPAAPSSMGPMTAYVVFP